jgi:ATP-binding cassette subfamily B protein
MIGGVSGLTLRLNNSVTRQRVKKGTLRRILPYVKGYRSALLLLLAVSALDAVIGVTNPLFLRLIVDEGISGRRPSVIIWLSLTMAGLALVDAAAIYILTWFSARISQGIICNLRIQIFRHVQKQSLAFFTRTATGSLVSRLNTDVIGTQEAVTSLLSQTVSAFLSLILVLSTMFYLSWQISALALAVIPIFVTPGRLIGKRVQRVTRERMQLDAEMGSMMNERFNVAGALLTKLFGRPDDEADLFAIRARRVRDISIIGTVYARAFFIVITLLAAMGTALIYGLGGNLVVDGTFQLGTLVAMIALVTRMYGPINQLSNTQVNLLTALVGFDRVFEVLDLKPLITERPTATALPARGAAAPRVEFERVCFRYPAASEVSLASLEPIALAGTERGNGNGAWILHEVSFCAPAGKLTALVGPSGAGKTTITHLVPRLYDPGSGTVLIDGHDIRDLTLRSLQETVGVVSQDAHLFHDTIRANLAYARPGATERDLIQACDAARIWDLIASLPEKLDTVVGDRGYRLSGGEKQRISLARLMLKAPPVVILDEATAHLDSESEAAIQQALKTALADRTSLVIAHRLSTIREADQILVIDAGNIRQRGTHEELIAEGGIYADFYSKQFAQQTRDA